MTASRHISDRERCPPELALERVIVDEISNSSSATWSDHIAGCLRCQERLREMERQAERYLASPQRAQLAYLLLQEQTARSPARQRVRLLYAAVPVALAAAGVALALWIINRPEVDCLTPKGDGVTTVEVWRNGEALPLEGTTPRQGDLIQLYWTAAEPGHLAMLARDAAGEVDIIFAAQDQSSRRVAAGARLPIGDGLMIDATTRDTALWILFSDSTFSLNPMIEALARGDNLTSRDFTGQLTQIDLTVAADGVK